MHVGFVVNSHRPDALEAAAEAASLLISRGLEVGVERSLASTVGVPPLLNDEIARCDLVVAFGGDGTLIRAAHVCSELGTPILGVHYGRFGFVTQCRPEDLPDALTAFVAGEYQLDRRMMLQTELRRRDQILATLHTLNESVLQRAVTDRMLTFEVEVDGKLLTAYPADGVMVSTPT
ncbi:NAD(+)/NADH kinase, partial [bacterium]